MRPQAVALSPDGSLIVTSGKTSQLVVIDAATLTVRKRVALPADVAPQEGREAPAGGGQLSYCGLSFSPDGSRLYLSNVNGSVKVFAVDDKGEVSPAGGWKLPPANAPRRAAEIASGLAVSPDGSKVYVCGNLSNTLFELSSISGEVLRQFDVGVRPTMCGSSATRHMSATGAADAPAKAILRGLQAVETTVRVDPVHDIASEGSVSVINLESGQVTDEVLTGLHASWFGNFARWPLARLLQR